jgi:hypothetical protein
MKGVQSYERLTIRIFLVGFWFRKFVSWFRLQSAVDAEEHLDYSAGKVTIIPDLKCWERKLDEANELGQTVSNQDE